MVLSSWRHVDQDGLVRVDIRMAAEDPRPHLIMAEIVHRQLSGVRPPGGISEPAVLPLLPFEAPALLQQRRVRQQQISVHQAEVFVRLQEDESIGSLVPTVEYTSRLVGLEQHDGEQRHQDDERTATKWGHGSSEYGLNQLSRNERELYPTQQRRLVDADTIKNPVPCQEHFG